MNKEDYEIIDTIIGELNGDCPNCEGLLRKRGDDGIRCNSCGMDIAIESRKERLLLWGFMGSVALVALGYIIGLVI